MSEIRAPLFNINAMNGIEQSGIPALIWRGTSITYGELYGLITAHQRSLDGLNISSERSVAVEADKSPATLALIIALESRGIPVLILPRGLGAEVRPRVCAKANAAIELRVNETALTVIPFANRENAAGVDVKLAAFILTTSGSTGVPKGVCLARDAIARFMIWARSTFGLEVGTTVLSYAPLNFDLSLLEVWAALNAGATVAIAEWDQAADAAAMARLVVETAPNILQGVPLLYKLLTEAPYETYTGVRDVIVTGEAATVSLRSTLAKHFPDSRFHNIYGSTETNDSFILSCDAGQFAAPTDLPIGLPIPGAAYHLVDEEGADVIGPGEGELHTATPFAASGYTDAEQTKASFYFRDEVGLSRWYFRTGDIAQRRLDGSLSLIGRRDYVVKVRGVRINLRDIEAVLELHHQIEQAVVCPLPDLEGGCLLHAVVHLRAACGVNSLDLRQHCAAHLPRSAIPGQFTLTETSLPRTSTGKPDRKSLAASLINQGASV